MIGLVVKVLRSIFAPVSGGLSLFGWLSGSVGFSILQLGFVCSAAFQIGADLALLAVSSLVRRVSIAAALARPWSLPAEYRRYRLKQALADARSYEDWRTAAKALDHEIGSDIWRDTDESTDYDWSTCAKLCTKLQKQRHGKQDAETVAMTLRGALNRSFAGLGNQKLYGRCFHGTKKLVDKTYQEIAESLQYLADSEDMSYSDKASFFNRSRVAVGSTALCLSGGGALSMGHMGVIRVLLEHGVMPRVVSGTSGGSIPAAMLAWKTDEEMLTEVCTPDISNKHGVRWFDPVAKQVFRFATTMLSADGARMMQSEHFARTCKAYYKNYTFEEAFQRTGRDVSITITVNSPGAPRSAHPMVLNHITSPQVLLWSAVAASCALPGLMRPVTLMSKARDGRAIPYHPAGVETLDGSVHSDIPSEQLAQMFNVQRFLVSQVNPHVTLTSRLLDSSNTPGEPASTIRSWCDNLDNYVNVSIQGKLVKLAKLRLIPRMFGVEMGNVFLQKYRGHVTVSPHISLLDQFKALQHPSEADMVMYLLQGARATWPALAAARGLLSMEQSIAKHARSFPYHRLAVSPEHERKRTPPLDSDDDVDRRTGSRGRAPRIKTPIVDPLSGIGAAVGDTGDGDSEPDEAADVLGGVLGPSTNAAGHMKRRRRHDAWRRTLVTPEGAVHGGRSTPVGTPAVSSPAQPKPVGAAGRETSDDRATGSGSDCDSDSSFWASSRSWFVSDGRLSVAGGRSFRKARERRPRGDTL